MSRYKHEPRQSVGLSIKTSEGNRVAIELTHNETKDKIIIRIGARTKTTTQIFIDGEKSLFNVARIEDEKFDLIER